MSLLKWKELAQKKTELGKKINYVHNAITKHKIGDETSQESFGKLFKPVTSKLDDVIDSNLNLRIKRPQKKAEVPNYGIDIEDEVEDMGLYNLFGDYVPPQQEKQIVPKPPTYDESLQDLMEGKKEIYVDPQYFPGDLGEQPPDIYQDPKKLPSDIEELPSDPPKYTDDEGVDYTIDDDDDETNYILNDLGINNYDSVNMILNQPEMTTTKQKNYLIKIISKARKKRQQMNGYKANNSKKFTHGKITKSEFFDNQIRIDKYRSVLTKYMKHYENKYKSMKGYGIKGRGRKQRGGNVIFFNDVKQLLKKLELIIGEVIAGNTSIQIRNTGVNILDTLLRMSTINRSQYNKLYNQYFRV